ncbi:MAG TPA: ATP-grasp domain-containing protein [Coriobacteriia bacterium]|nr:ATP-grasp domain-containing protein [Coriobacteriia bacterium]
MFILEDPYVSDLLAATVRELGLPVLDTPMARAKLGGNDGSCLLTSADAFAAAVTPATRLYSNSENAIGWISQHLAHTDLPRRIGLFKDKVAFRELIADLYPDYRFVGLGLSELRDFDPSRLRTPFVIKPAVGFFSMSVHIVDSAEAWPGIVERIERETAAFAQVYPNQVIGMDRFVAEEVIEGEEFAVDAYFDAEGRPVLVNVLAHLFASADDVSDRVYLTNAETVERLGAPAMEFLAEVGRRANLTDFPVHAEMRIDSEGRIAPIEINPMRFGGWCATDLAHFAYGVNPYRCYLRGETPDWARIAEETAGRTTALVIADLPGTVDLSAIESVDYQQFAERFTNVLEVRPTDFSRYPVFAFTFVDVPSDDLSELHAVLGVDLSGHLRMRECA